MAAWTPRAGTRTEVVPSPWKAPGLARAVAVACLSAGCLIACSPMHPGAAATVGSKRISVAELNAAVAHDAASAPATAPADRTTAVESSLTTLIRNDLIAAGAAAQGITVSEADIQALLAQQRQTNGTDEATAKANGIPIADLHTAVYQALLLSKLEQKVSGTETDTTKQQQLLLTFLTKVAGQQGVSVNPRYGVWQAAQFSVVAGDTFSSQAPGAPAVSSPAG